jgi:hypothetical protein
MPGETVKLIGWKVTVCQTSDETEKSCKQLKEDYLWADILTEARCGVSSFDVKDGYLVFGDNRPFSTDSRCCFGLGCTSWSSYTVSTNRIIGKVFARIFPSPTTFTNESSRYK